MLTMRAQNHHPATTATDSSSALAVHFVRMQNWVSQNTFFTLHLCFWHIPLSKVTYIEWNSLIKIKYILFPGNQIHYFSILASCATVWTTEMHCEDWSINYLNAMDFIRGVTVLEPHCSPPHGSASSFTVVHIKSDDTSVIWLVEINV